jgi:hypothetical protein
MDTLVLRRAINWNSWYEPAWDSQPVSYLDAGILRWGRTRRLGRHQPGRGLVAYVGVQHVDPVRWGSEVDPACRFFASCRNRQTSWLRTAPTMPEALTVLALALPAMMTDAPG